MSDVPTINKREYDLVTRVLTEDLAKRELGLCSDEEKAEEEFAIETYKKVGRILVAHKEIGDEIKLTPEEEEAVSKVKKFWDETQ